MSDVTLSPESLKTRALMLLAQELLHQVDEIASLRANGYEARLSAEMLREMASVLVDLDGETKDQYLYILQTLAPGLAERAVPEYRPEWVENVVDSKRRLIQTLRRDLQAA